MRIGAPGALAFLVGCVSLSEHRALEAEVAAAQATNARQVESLTRLEDRLVSTQVAGERTLAERDAARAQLEDANATIAERDLKIAEGVKAREALSARIAEVEAELARDRAKLQSVVQTATAQVEEMARLRTQSEEFAQREESLKSANTALRAEVAKARRELDKTNSDLLAANAVIRSISSGRSDGSDAKTLALEEKVRQLEAEKRALEARGPQSPGSDETERTHSEMQVAHAGATDGDEPPKTSAKAAASVGFFSLVKERFAGIRAGTATWDGVDCLFVTAAGLAACALIWFLCMPLRSRRKAKAAARVRTLQRRVQELERAGTAASAGGASSRGARRGTGVSVRRSSSFSPVIAAPPPEPEEEEAYAEEPEYEEEVTVQLGAIRSSADSGHPSADETWADAEEEEDEFANTQIIPTLSELEDLEGPPRPAPRRKRGNSSDMGDLKDLIGQKVDELIR